MTIVVDASLAAAWLLPDEGTDATDWVLARVETSGGVAPSIFRHEVRHIMLLAEKRKRITGVVGDALLIRLARLPIQDGGPEDDALVVGLARTHDLTAYDAAYLDLALGWSLPLATLDRRLAEAARTAGVTVLGFPATPAP